MKTNYWFNRNRLLSHARFTTALLLAGFAAVFVSAPTPASARHEVPFRAAFGTEVQIEFVYPFFYISVTGQGNASHLGATSAVTAPTKQQHYTISRQPSPCGDFLFHGVTAL
jgi:hypothetical protein